MDQDSLTRISIRRVPVTSIHDPTKALNLLRRIKMEVTDAEVTVLNGEPLLNEPTHAQMFIEFSKMEFVTRFKQLETDPSVTYKNLELRDPRETREIYKMASAKLKGRKGLRMFTVRHNQVLVQIGSDLRATEICNEQQVESALERLR